MKTTLNKTALQKTKEQSGIVVSAYLVAQPFGVWLSSALSSAGIPMSEAVATGVLLWAGSVVGRVVLHWWQHRVTDNNTIGAR